MEHISTENFSSIRLKIASPEDILRWSYGEVIKPETINYRTQRPEKDGLFSERIFGPTKDWECYCGKYRRIRYKNVVCDKCGVEVTRAIVRRERMGHIALAAPVCHIWFLRSVPSKIGLVLDVPAQRLERVIYYASYIVTKVNEENRKRVVDELERELSARKKVAKKESAKGGSASGGKKESVAELQTAASQVRTDLGSLTVGKVLSEAEYHALSRKFADVFEAGSGAQAVRQILERVDLPKEMKKAEQQVGKGSKDTNAERRLSRRLKLLRRMINSGIRPEWMIMTMLPVLPPDLRPMVPLDGGRYATSDLNDLYRRVINRNNRLKKLLELKAPEVIVVNEKRMLQEAVDALIDNSARFGTQQLSSQRRPLRSLADMLKGKQGRFRQNLLGKRVDYSGRSVIVIGPKLNIDECGLPKRMALELFKPFVISKMIERDLAHNIKSANRMIEQAPPEVWAILEEVIANRKVLLNRAPTLHRLSVQAFKPLLIEDLAIQIPALICAAFNADFDGDQMAVHVPLSHQAQQEASDIMLASKNLLKPATGEPVAIPSKDIVMGCHYLTKLDPEAKGAGRRCRDEDDALTVYDYEQVAVNAPIIVGSGKNKMETSCGRILLNKILPADFGFVNQTFEKKSLSKLTADVINRYGFEVGQDVLNKIQEIGFEYATRSGITWAMDDLAIPIEKNGLMDAAEAAAAGIRLEYEQGLLTEGERRARVISIWDKAKAELAKVVQKALAPQNSIYLIIDSGARGSWSQPIQMMGMKGLVQNPKGETIELPIKSSLKEGLSVLEYFISTHGARKGSTDTALKTAQAGYLTRRLVDVAQDLVVREEDCRTKEGIEIGREDGAEFGQSFASRIFSRTMAEDVKAGNKTLIKAGLTIDAKIAEAIDKAKIGGVKVRSAITCRTLYGVCAKCYGYDLGTNQAVKLGEAVGIIAAQSIGEPGTQLTMRTFHTGGVAGIDITHGLPRVEELFEIRPPKGKAVLAAADGEILSIEERGLLKVIILKTSGKKSQASAEGRSSSGGKVKTRAQSVSKAERAQTVEYPVHRSTTLFVKEGDEVEKGAQLSEGHIDLKELFEYRGAGAVERYVVNEVQRIYFSEGASINNKHIEIIIRQMFGRVRVKEAGDSDFVGGDIVEKSEFLEVNRAIRKAGGTPAKAVQLLMGITKVALSSSSFLSAASFQETARVLVNAASEGKTDKLRGLKENVIIGRLIPVGTGLHLAPSGAPYPNPSADGVSAADISGSEVASASASDSASAGEE
ncbi:MAG: DNA-directed RNA polymerase subunit beta' [bacterium]|nr:DNA-directed RNA polymerase subunit beta' [bacterium]